MQIDRDELSKRALAITKPLKQPTFNAFNGAFQRLCAKVGNLNAWELKPETEALIEGFVSSQLNAAADAIRRVILTTKAAISEDDVRAAFLDIRPTITELSNHIFANCNGSMLNVQPYQIEHNYNGLAESLENELSLLGTPASKPLRSERIDRELFAPDTNSLLHFDHISQITPAQIGASRSIEWLLLEQVIYELDQKTHHPRIYYHKRARSLIKLLSRATAGSPIMENGARLWIYFPKALPVVAGLDLTVADHRLLAQAIAFQQENEGARVTLATNDLALTIRARSLDMPTIVLPGRREQSDPAGAEDDAGDEIL